MNEATIATGTNIAMAARLEDVSKLYGRFAALRRVTVEFTAQASPLCCGWLRDCLRHRWAR
jgi:hypothetical protein